jgi:hypothetical protein
LRSQSHHLSAVSGRTAPPPRFFAKSAEVIEWTGVGANPACAKEGKSAQTDENKGLAAARVSEKARKSLKTSGCARGAIGKRRGPAGEAMGALLPDDPRLDEGSMLSFSFTRRVTSRRRADIYYLMRVKRKAANEGRSFALLVDVAS